MVMDTRQTETDRPGYRVGELAAVAGLTVRTLHHFGDIGLLVASGRTAAGHRVYSDADVERLFRICSLRRLGLGLTQIGVALDDHDGNLHAALQAQLRDLDRRAATEIRLRARLSRLVASTDLAENPSTDDLLALLEDMTMLDNPVKQRISILVYSDIETTYHYLTRVFGLEPGELTRNADGVAVHAELSAGDGVVWLHAESPQFGLASPRTVGAATATMAVMVDDVDAHYRHSVSEGAPIVYEPVDQPYGYREYSARDCEGGLWSFMKPLTAPTG